MRNGEIKTLMKRNIHISFEIIFGRLIDEQINIALETRESLVNQREILKVGVSKRYE